MEREEEIIVNYYYRKSSTVTVKYVDKLTGEEITEETIITGYEDDDYEAEEKEIEGYDIDEEEYPENTKGKIEREAKEVIFYYKKKAKVIAEYRDKETNEKIEKDEEKKGYIKDKYETAEKKIEYYDLIEEPKNSKGEMTEEEIKVIYYYKKKPFNISIEKNIKATIINGGRRKINKKISKEEISGHLVEETTLKVEYSIVVENKGEIAGSAKIEENIPAGMNMLQEENPGWTVNGNNATLTTEEIRAGRSKEYIVTLTWNNDEENFGIKENIVKIKETKNKAGFKETDTNDNEDTAQIAITVSTGMENITPILMIALVSLVLAGIGVTAIKVITKQMQI